MAERLDHLLQIGEIWLSDDAIVDYIGSLKKDLAALRPWRVG